MIINYFPLSTHLITVQEISEFWTIDQQMIMGQVWDRCRGAGSLRRNETQSLSDGFGLSLSVGRKRRLASQPFRAGIEGMSSSSLSEKKARVSHTHTCCFFLRVGPF